ncbi:hypothetical protein LIER_22294 [Lithospermum erythrorhizon]|uniref:Uncharacterized protein n=1 Tax=Lithospermum erythrorhizon TaxID=34254 RepID=A0AAV3QWC6_LITER
MGEGGSSPSSIPNKALTHSCILSRTFCFPQSRPTEANHHPWELALLGQELRKAEEEKVVACWAACAARQQTEGLRRAYYQDSPQRSVFPVNLLNVGSFIPTGMTALKISGEKGAKPANSILVPRRTCPAKFVERVSTCRCRAATTSGRGAGLQPHVPTSHVGFVVRPQVHYPSH